MWIKRQNHHLIHPVSLDVRNGGLSEGMPVAHGHITGGVDAALTQKALKLPGLLLCDPAQRRATSDGAVGTL